MPKKTIIQNYYRVTYPFRIAYRFVFRPEGTAVKVLIKHKETGEFLLVRHTYGHKLWSVPGGRAERDESFEKAAVREAEEELQMQVKNLIEIGMYTSRVEFNIDHVKVFLAEVEAKSVVIDPIEIKEAKWFRADQLPKDSIPRVMHIFDMLTKYTQNHADRL